MLRFGYRGRVRGQVRYMQMMIELVMMSIEISDESDAPCWLHYVIEFVEKFVSADCKVRDDDY